MVVTPHCGAHSLSVDLTSDEISATGGRQRFALERFALLVSARIRARTAGGIPASRTAHDRTPGRFCLTANVRIFNSRNSTLWSLLLFR